MSSPGRPVNSIESERGGNAAAWAGKDVLQEDRVAGNAAGDPELGSELRVVAWKTTLPFTSTKPAGDEAPPPRLRDSSAEAAPGQTSAQAPSDSRTTPSARSFSRIASVLRSAR